jgi:hypothetical protein
MVRFNWTEIAQKDSTTLSIRYPCPKTGYSLFLRMLTLGLYCKTA